MYNCIATEKNVRLLYSKNITRAGQEIDTVLSIIKKYKKLYLIKSHRKNFKLYLEPTGIKTVCIHKFLRQFDE